MVRTWVDVIRSYLRSPIVGRLWGFLIGLIFYANAVYFLTHTETTEDGRWVLVDPTAQGSNPWVHIDIKPQFHVLQGTILGLLLVFRTTTAYDRWWEGRKLWGQLVNDLRNLALKVKKCVDASPEEKRQFGEVLIVFAHALREHLSWKPPKHTATLQGEDPIHAPLLVAGRVFEKLNGWEKSGALNQILIFDAHSRGLMDVCGACERIKKTPIARSYRVFIRLCITFYMLTLPWGLADEFHVWMIPAAAIIGYFMIGIELLAEDAEQPFGRGGDKLALEDICQGIERSVRETLG